jgi:hypothetical protein
LYILAFWVVQFENMGSQMGFLWPSQQLRFRGFAAAILGNASSRTVFHPYFDVKRIVVGRHPVFSQHGLEEILTPSF